MQPLQPWKRQNECWELFQEHNVPGWSKDLKPTKCPSAASAGAFYEQPETNGAARWEASSIDQLQKRVHLEVKDIDVGLLQNAFRGLMTKVKHSANNGL